MDNMQDNPSKMLTIWLPWTINKVGEDALDIFVEGIKSNYTIYVELRGEQLFATAVVQSQRNFSVQHLGTKVSDLRSATYRCELDVLIDMIHIDKALAQNPTYFYNLVVKQSPCVRCSASYPITCTDDYCASKANKNRKRAESIEDLETMIRTALEEYRQGKKQESLQ